MNRFEGTSDSPPLYFWIIPAVVCLLRILPFVWTHFLLPPAGMYVQKFGYNPNDFLQYLAFMRQLPEDGSWIGYNPFTTEPQEPRFILAFFWLLGWAASLSGAAPEVVLELSRIPLIFLFFGVLWWFLKPILPPVAQRLWACVLVAFSGGMEGFVKPLTPLLPHQSAAMFRIDTWHMFGWNTFEAAYNPLWVASLLTILLVLRPVFAPQGPRKVHEFAVAGLGFFMIYWIHPYSAVVLLAVIVVSPAPELIFTGKFNRRKYTRIGFMLLPSVLVWIGVGIWQRTDLVYRLSASGFFGPQALSVFWYPITLGCLLVFALRGARRFFTQNHPYRWALVSWIAAVALLHSSPLVNGYHFVFHLHLPVSILAACEVHQFSQNFKSSTALKRIAWIVVLFGLFSSAFFVTVESMQDIRRRNLIPDSYVKATEDLAARPKGNALVPPRLGNILPAYTPHKVWAGHWFLTPQYRQKAERFRAFVKDPKYLSEFIEIVRNQNIDYIVLPAERSAAVMGGLAGEVKERIHYGTLDLLIVR